MEKGYTVFARRYRPVTFADVAGQEHVATTLQNAITEKRVGHAYLFSGPRGVGKTSMARVFARALNCTKGPTPDPCGTCEICLRIHEGTDSDVVEMDAASNRGVDDARALREGVRYAPLRSRFKIYIVDEAHMLTREAFNTLLKTLEEPPPHVKFIFATTETHKIPDTIASRCQRFEFRRITSRDIAARLRQIAKQEHLTLPEEVVASVARAGHGSMRDAQSLLDQIVAYKTGAITPEDVTQLLGCASDTHLAAFFDAIASSDAKRTLDAVDRVFRAGVDGTAFTDQLLERARTLLLLSACGSDSTIVDLPESDLASAAAQASRFSLEALLYLVQVLLEMRRRQREGTDPRLLLEVAGIKLSKIGDLASLPEALRLLSSSPATPARETPRPAAPIIPAAAPVVPTPTPEPDVEETSASIPESKETIQDRWGQVVEKTKARNMLAGTLLAEGRVARLGADEVEFILPAKFTKFHVDQLVLPKNRTIIEEILQTVYGKRLTFAVALDKAAAAAAGTVFRAASPPAPTGVADDPAVKRVMDAFPGSKIVGIQ